MAELIIAGESSYEFLVARYNSNGTLDTTFGTDGLALANFSSNWDGATDAVLQPDGKIVLVGWSVRLIVRTIVSPWRGSIQTVRWIRASAAVGRCLWSDQGDLNAVALQSDGKLIATRKWQLYIRHHISLVAL